MISKSQQPKKSDGFSSEQKLHRLTIARQDFDNAKKCLSERESHQFGCLVWEALVSYAIISYARPFTNNEKDKKSTAAPRLDLSDFLYISENERSIHERCMMLRNKAIAHSEIDFNPTALHSNGVIVSRPFSIVSEPQLESRLLIPLSDLIQKVIVQCTVQRLPVLRLL